MTALSTEAYVVAWALFHARCTEDEAKPDEIEQAWLEPAMREFWLNQAQIALDALTLHRRGLPRKAGCW